RCFPHIVNIAVQTMLKEMKENAFSPVVECGADIPADELTSYAEALDSDPVNRTRGIVGVCRASGGRRKELKDAIEDGNKSNTWGEIIRVVQLLRDCETRWSSTYNMIDRTMELYPVKPFLHCSRRSDKQYEVLGHIHQILEIPHRAQELLAAEKTPTLAMALPVYEKLIELWKSLALSIPEMSHYIGLGVTKIMEYISKGRHNKIYALAMILNPRTKFQWMEQHWELHDCVAAEISSVIAARQWRRPEPQAGPHLAAVPRLNIMTSASRSQACGFAGLSSLTTIHRTACLPSTSNASTQSRSSSPYLSAQLSASPPPTNTLTAEQMASQDAEDAAQDLTVVKSEIYRWKQAPLRTMDEKFDLVCFWEAIETDFPLMFKVAVDILPTCALRRNLLSSALLEVLQVLKHVYKQGRLDFTSGLIATEDDYSIESTTEAAINELVSLGKNDELLDLLRSMDEHDDNT
ncbi:ribonuclease H-like domain-containing protein, partial [Lactarius deliciosus]